MNKKLIALAVAGALAAPLAAHADAQIYGQMHVSVDYIDNATNTATVYTDKTGTVLQAYDNSKSSLGVSSRSSRLGFKGSEDLGSGLTAVWQVESAVNLTDNKGGTSLAGRNSFVGLAGGFGTALVGRHDTPLKGVGRAVDLFGDTIGDSRAMINLDAQHARPDNVIAYVTPNFSGLQAVLAYVTDMGYKSLITGSQTDDTKRSAYSASLSYSNGPLYVGLATQSLSTKGLYSANAAATDDAKVHLLAASYDLSAFKITGLYQRDQNIVGIKGWDRNTWGVGGAYKFGNNAVKAQFYKADKIDKTSKTDSNQITVGFDHAMSKQTSVYALYTRVDNNDGATANVTTSDLGDIGPAGGVAAGKDPAAFSVGMVHKF